MDRVAFHFLYHDIVLLDGTEGPHTNVFEPKFKAREQMLQLKATVTNMYQQNKSLLALQQLCRCMTFVGRNMTEVDEEADGLRELQQAYRVLHWCVHHTLPDELAAIPPIDTADIVSQSSSASPASDDVVVISAEQGFDCCVEFIMLHNALGLQLSQDRLADAKAVLRRAEAAYRAWDAWSCAQPVHCAMSQLDIDGEGNLVRASLAALEPALAAVCLTRYNMNRSYTLTLLSLAQLCTSLGEAEAASLYCHRTLYYQLVNRQSFSRKTWATNALQLSSFYSGRGEFDKAWHCLQAGARQMPDSETTPHDDKENAGLVAWSYGRYYLDRLHMFGLIKQGRYGSIDELREALIQRSSSSNTHSDGDAAGQLGSWVDFPDVAPAQPQPAIADYEAARAAFKQGHKWLQEALRCYPFETCCTQHIDLLQTISRLYAALAVFETNRTRLIAMTQRQIALLEPIPDQLNFNAYPTTVRQLLYDLASLYEDVLRLRAEQRACPFADERPLADDAFNALVRLAAGYYDRFCETWRLPTTHKIPDVLDVESALPFFRALTQRAHVQLRMVHATVKDEYDGLTVVRAMLQRAIDFAARQSFAEEVREQVAKEVALVKQMQCLVAAKQSRLRGAAG